MGIPKHQLASEPIVSWEPKSGIHNIEIWEVSVETKLRAIPSNPYTNAHVTVKATLTLSISASFRFFSVVVNSPVLVNRLRPGDPSSSSTDRSPDAPPNTLTVASTMVCSCTGRVRVLGLGFRARSRVCLTVRVLTPLRTHSQSNPLWFTAVKTRLELGLLLVLGFGIALRPFFVSCVWGRS